MERGDVRRQGERQGQHDPPEPPAGEVGAGDREGPGDAHHERGRRHHRRQPERPHRQIEGAAAPDFVDHLGEALREGLHPQVPEGERGEQRGERRGDHDEGRDRQPARAPHAAAAERAGGPGGRGGHRVSRPACSSSSWVAAMESRSDRSDRRRAERVEGGQAAVGRCDPGDEREFLGLVGEVLLGLGPSRKSTSRRAASWLSEPARMPMPATLHQPTGVAGGHEAVLDPHGVVAEFGDPLVQVVVVDQPEGDLAVLDGVELGDVVGVGLGLVGGEGLQPLEGPVVASEHPEPGHEGLPRRPLVGAYPIRPFHCGSSTSSMEVGGSVTTSGS